MAQQKLKDAENPAVAAPGGPDEFVQASVALNGKGARGMREESNRYQFRLEKRQAQVVEVVQSGKTERQVEKVAEDWLKDKLNQKGALRLGELGFTNVRGANLAGLELEVKPDGTTMRLEDFLLSASKAQIEAVMPKMVWQNKDTASSLATIFSANETINNKIRERLLNGCKEYDGHAIAQQNDLRDCDAARSELLRVDRWAGGKREGKLTNYQYQAKEQIERKYLENHYGENEGKRIAEALAHGAGIKAFKNVDESIACKKFVNDEYRNRGFEIVKELQKNDNFLETQTYIQLRNSVKAELTEALRTPRKSRTPGNEPPAQPVSPQETQPEGSFVQLDLSGVLSGGNRTELKNRLDALPEPAEENAKVVLGELEEFLSKAPYVEESMKIRGFDPHVSATNAPPPGEEEERALFLSDLVDRLKGPQALFGSIENGMRDATWQGNQEYKELIQMTREEFKVLLEVDLVELKATEEKLRESVKWRNEVEELIGKKGAELDRRYREIMDGSGSEPEEGEVIELLRRKKETLERIQYNHDLGALDDQGKGVILIDESFRQEKINALKELSERLAGWDEERLVGGRGDRGAVANSEQLGVPGDFDLGADISTGEEPCGDGNFTYSEDIVLIIANGDGESSFLDEKAALGLIDDFTKNIKEISDRISNTSNESDRQQIAEEIDELVSTFKFVSDGLVQGFGKTAFAFHRIRNELDSLSKMDLAMEVATLSDNSVLVVNGQAFTESEATELMDNFEQELSNIRDRLKCELDEPARIEIKNEIDEMAGYVEILEDGLTEKFSKTVTKLHKLKREVNSLLESAKFETNH
jgi:hypothetical protein